MPYRNTMRTLGKQFGHPKNLTQSQVNRARLQSTTVGKGSNGGGMGRVTRGRWREGCVLKEEKQIPTNNNRRGAYTEVKNVWGGET